MVAVSNRCTYPGILLEVLPLLWLGMCLLMRLLFSVRLPEAKGVIAIVELFCSFMSFRAVSGDRWGDVHAAHLTFASLCPAW